MTAFIEELQAISAVDWLGMLTGIVGVYLSIKEKILAWPIFIICYGCYVYIALRGNYFAFAGLNLLFMGIGAYGWFAWSRKNDASKPTLSVSRLPKKFYLPLVVLVGGGTVALAFLTDSLGEAQRPFLDGFASCSALAAQWMLGKKYLENWFAWIIADIVWIYVFFQDKIWLSVILFSTFIILAVKGISEWTKQLQLRNIKSA